MQVGDSDCGPEGHPLLTEAYDPRTGRMHSHDPGRPRAQLHKHSPGVGGLRSFGLGAAVWAVERLSTRHSGPLKVSSTVGAGQHLDL